MKPSNGSTSVNEETVFLNICFHEHHQRVASPPELTARHPDVKQPEYYGCIENMDDAAGRILKS